MGYTKNDMFELSMNDRRLYYTTFSNMTFLTLNTCADITYYACAIHAERLCYRIAIYVQYNRKQKTILKLRLHHGEMIPVAFTLFCNCSTYLVFSREIRLHHRFRTGVRNRWCKPGCCVNDSGNPQSQVTTLRNEACINKV